jgi:hypothetical protein
MSISKYSTLIAKMELIYTPDSGRCNTLEWGNGSSSSSPYQPLSLDHAAFVWINLSNIDIDAMMRKVFFERQAIVTGNV